jgi:hypothetical protein
MSPLNVSQTNAMRSAAATSFPNTAYKLSPGQSHAVVLLASGSTQRHVAEMLGLTAETICRWARRPEFERAVAEAQRELVESVRSWNLSLLGKAMERLGALLDHQSPQVQLRAAELVLRSVVVPLVALKDVREPRLDEDDFQSFVRTFTKQTDGGNAADDVLTRTALAHTAVEARQ